MSSHDFALPVLQTSALRERPPRPPRPGRGGRCDATGICPNYNRLPYLCAVSRQAELEIWPYSHHNLFLCSGMCIFPSFVFLPCPLFLPPKMVLADF